VIRAALAIVFWSIAAVLVALTHQWLDAASAVASVVVEVGAIIATAAAYIRFAAPDARLDHALFVGTTWVVLAIVAEIAMTASSGRQWFALLGSPAHGGLRCALLIAWVLAPALFATKHE
jgi:hypothetical protein